MVIACKRAALKIIRLWRCCPGYFPDHPSSHPLSFDTVGPRHIMAYSALLGAIPGGRWAPRNSPIRYRGRASTLVYPRARNTTANVEGRMRDRSGKDKIQLLWLHYQKYKQIAPFKASRRLFYFCLTFYLESFVENLSRFAIYNPQYDYNLSKILQ